MDFWSLLGLWGHLKQTKVDWTGLCSILIGTWGAATEILAEGIDTLCFDNKPQICTGFIWETNEIKLQNRVFFLAELLLWYLTGNILGIEVLCGRRVDDMQTMCGWHADDVRMTREWDFGWDFTGGWHMSSRTSSRLFPELPNFMQYYTWCHLHVICRHTCNLHVICTSSAHTYVIKDINETSLTDNVQPNNSNSNTNWEELPSETI